MRVNPGAETPHTVGNQNFCLSMMLPMEFSQEGENKLEILGFDKKLRFRTAIQVSKPNQYRICCP